MNDFDKNSSNFWKFLVTQAKTQEFYGNSSPNFAKNSIFRQVQSPTMPKKWPKKEPALVLTLGPEFLQTGGRDLHLADDDHQWLAHGVDDHLRLALVVAAADVG